jgi:hypothetical protein
MYSNYSNGVLQGTYNTLEEAQAAMALLVQQNLPNLTLTVPTVPQ